MYGSVERKAPTTVDTLDIAKEPPAIVTRMPKSTRQEDSVYHVYEGRSMDGSRYSQNWVFHKERLLKVKAAMGMVLNEITEWWIK